jgi:HK97 family phage major capsid protein
VVALYGDASLAATIGRNGGTEIVSSDQRYFDQDLTAFRGIKRVAFSVHDIGNASATESLRTPGPIVALALTT